MLLPYSFSKMHGVLLHETGNDIQLWIHDGTHINAIQEARRVFNAPFKLNKVSSHQFDLQLQKIYHKILSMAL